MSHSILYTQCPVCQAAQQREVFAAKDYTVSNESFMILECPQCSLRYTQGIPDAAHIGPYYHSENYISHTNTYKGLVNRLYQAVRKRTIRSKVAMVKNVTGLDKGTHLDVGSGTGTFANAMREAGWQTTGLEPDPDARAMAKNLYGLDLRETAELYTLPEGHFDVITLWHVMEHVHDLHPYVQRMQQLLKPGGTLIIAVPNYTSKDAEIYGPYWAAYDVPRHLYHFSPASVRALVQQHGLEVKAYKPMWYDSFYISMLSNKYQKGSTGLISAVWNGLRSNLKALSDVQRCSSVIYIIQNAK